MKSSLKLLPLALCALLPLSSFAGGNSGGGGGGICLQNKCMTLAQAGFRIHDQKAEFNPLITHELIEELDKLLSIMPPQLEFDTSKIIGQRFDILTIEVTDEQNSASFIQEYQKILRENGAPSLAESVELMAFTSEKEPQRNTSAKVTYLIKGKFDSLSLRGQALILIHEYMIREANFSVEEALAFDGALLDYLSALENGKREMTGLINGYLRLSGNYFKETANSMHLNEALFGNKPLNLKSNGIAYLGRATNLDYYHRFSLTHDKVFRLSKQYPKLKNYDASIAIEFVKLQRHKVLLDFEKYIYEKVEKSESKSFLLNNASFTNYLKEKNIHSQSFNICGDLQDSQQWFVGNLKEKNLNVPYYVECGVSPSLRSVKEIRLGKNGSLFDKVTGLDLRLDKDYNCKLGTFNKTLTCK